jgi:peroxiredoxin
MIVTIVLCVIVGGLSLAVVALGGLVFQLVREHGAILLRLEDLEQREASPGLAGESGAAPNGRPDGLPVGTPLRPFSLPDFSGKRLTLDAFPGRRLLVHWSPDCSFCGLIAGELAGLRDDIRAHGAEIVLVSWGGVETNRSFADQHGLDYPILLQEGSEPVDAFSGLGTPVGYLVDERASTASPLAYGGDEVLQLAKELASGRRRLRTERPLSESRIERNGLRAGTPAPPFELPDLNGQPIAIEAFRGQRVLLVFSDPGCGPCNVLAPELVQYNGDSELAVLMVSRGDAETNRSKAQQLGLDFPIVIQPGWQVSRKYGIFATPSAFLVNEQGVIAHDVAQGREQILTLAQNALRARREEQRQKAALA